MGCAQRGNEILGTLLAELGWSPSQLAEGVNALRGPGSVARSTVSEWLHKDRVPREPLPTVVAHLISDALDREVSVAQVWSGRAQPAEFWVPADHGLRLPWTAAGTVEVLDDWLRHAGGSIGMDRRIFLAVSGASLTAPAWEYVDLLGIRGDSFAALADGRRSITVTSAMVDAVAITTAGIRNLGNTPKAETRTTCGSCTTTSPGSPNCCAKPGSAVARWPTGCSPSGRNWHSWARGWPMTRVGMACPSGISRAGCMPRTLLATAR